MFKKMEVKQFILRAKQSVAMVISASILCWVMNVAQALPFSAISQVYFFGDSLTDSGFNDDFTEPNPGKAPTFTTFGGYIWSQYIAHDIKGFVLPVYPGPNPPDTITNNTIFANTGDAFVSGTLRGVDYAAGGSTTNSSGYIFEAPSLLQQVNYFLATSGPRLDPNALYFIWSGANDFLSLLANSPTLPTQLQLLMTAQTAAINISNAVAALSARGAKRVVVLNLPNLGLIPFAASFGDPTIPPALQSISFTFNSMLNTQLGGVIAHHGTKILYVDTYTLLNTLVKDILAGKPYVVAGQSFMFTNYTSQACGGVSALICPSSSSALTGYVFADSVHPSNMTHRVLSLIVESLIQEWK